MVTLAMDSLTKPIRSREASEARMTDSPLLSRRNMLFLFESGSHRPALLQLSVDPRLPRLVPGIEQNRHEGGREEGRRQPDEPGLNARERRSTLPHVGNVAESGHGPGGQRPSNAAPRLEAECDADRGQQSRGSNAGLPLAVVDAIQEEREGNGHGHSARNRSAT